MKTRAITVPGPIKTITQVLFPKRVVRDKKKRKAK